jgi:type IV secretion system protein VirB1
MIELIMACAPDVAPSTIQEIIKVESAGDTLALNVNRLRGQKTPRFKKPLTPKEAANTALAFIQAGHSVDMGLMQINSNNLERFGVSSSELAQVFSPCFNIWMGAEILKESYSRAALKRENPQKALQAALSAYNTGNFNRGFENGYVTKFYGRSVSSVPNKTAYQSETSVIFNYSDGSNETKNQGEKMNTDQQKDSTPNKEVLNEIDPLKNKLQYMDAVPGIGVEVDPDEAELMGAFSEDAMDFEDVQEASLDPREAP